MSHHRTIIKPVALTAVLFLSACASVPSEKTSSPDATAAQQPALQETGTPAEPTPDEVVQGVLAGEYLGSEGQTVEAAEEYVRAALASQDPKLSARATEISIAAGAFDLAGIAADHWLKLAPKDESALQSGIIASLGAGDSTMAEYYLTELLAVNEDNPERALAMLVAVLPQLPDEDQAADFLNQLIDEGTLANSAEALQGQSRLAAQLGDIPQARALADAAIAATDQPADALIWAGRLAALDGDNEAALDYYQKSLELDAERDTQLAIAELHKRLENYQAADEILAQLEADPGVIFTRIAYAREAGQEDRAIRLYQMLQEMISDRQSELDDQQWFFAAQAAALMEDGSQAIDWYEKVDKESGFYVDAAIRQATLQAQQGDLAAGLETVEPLQFADDASAVERGFLARSELLREAGQLQAARQSMGLGLTRLNSSIALLYGRGILSAQLNDVAAAESDFRRVLEIDPNNVDALNALGYTLTDLTDRHEEAYNLIRQAHAARPGDPAILDSMGWVLFQLERPSEALPFLQQAWEADANPEIAAHLGEVLWVLDQKERARSIWREGLEAAGDHAVLNATLQRLGVEI